MPLNLAATLAPTLNRVFGLLGATLRFRAVTGTTRAADNATTPAWADLAGMASVPAQLTDVSATAAARVWGQEQEVTAEAYVTRVASAAIVPRQTGIVVLDGPRAGQKFLIVDLRPDDLSGLVRLALALTRDTLGLP